MSGCHPVGSEHMAEEKSYEKRFLGQHGKEKM
jgi:hypothetical protein